MSESTESLGQRLLRLLHVGGSLSSIATVLAPSLTVLGAGVALAIAVVPQVPVSFFAAGIATAMIVGSTLTGFSALSRRRRRMALDINPDWRIEKCDRRAVVLSTHNVDYEYEIVAVARRDGMDTFSWETMWTGAGRYDVEPLGKGIEYHKDKLTTAFGEKFRLILDVPVKRGTRCTFKFKIITRATDLPKPFVSTSVKHDNWPKESLLAVQFDGQLDVEAVGAEEYVEGVPWPYLRKDLSLDGNRVASYPFKRKLGRRYVISWSVKEPVSDV